MIETDDDGAGDEGEPLATAAGELGEATVRVFDRGKPLGRRAIGEADARRLVKALETAVRRSRSEPAPEGAPFPSRDEILKAGWTIELRYEIPVDQTKLGLVPENTTRAVDLNRFLLPLTDPPPGTDPRFHPYTAFRVDGRPVEFDWSDQNRRIVRTTAKLDELRRLLGELGIDATSAPGP